MRRKRRRRKPWSVRLLSLGGMLRGAFQSKPKVDSASRAAAPLPPGPPGKTGTVRLAGREGVRKQTPAAAPKPAARPAPAEQPKAAGPRAKVPVAREKTETDGNDALPEAPPAKETWYAIYWRKAGGGSLVLSLVVHLVMLGIASLIVTSVVRDKSVDFLAGGGTKAGQAASENLAHQLKTKKRTALNRPVPLRKIVSLSNTAAIALPDLPPPVLDLPEMKSILGGTMGSAGFGSSGAGGGFGSGMGIGGMKGRSLKPIVMFGKNTGAHSIAVILDVSGSMTPHLRQVIEELDRVAKGSPVVLYVGCGVGTPPEGVHIDDATTPTRFPQFKAYWQADHGPEEDVYNILQRRPFTYFIKSQGIQYAWVSLLTHEVRHAEALYWFSDFQDDVDEKQLESVLTNLKRRKQKLFIHASDEGNEFERIRDKLCLPTGGSAIEVRR